MGDLGILEKGLGYWGLKSLWGCQFGVFLAFADRKISGLGDLGIWGFGDLGIGGFGEGGTWGS